jgi:hypothetical protein
MTRTFVRRTLAIRLPVSRTRPPQRARSAPTRTYATVASSVTAPERAKRAHPWSRMTGIRAPQMRAHRPLESLIRRFPPVRLAATRTSATATNSAMARARARRARRRRPMTAIRAPLTHATQFRESSTRRQRMGHRVPMATRAMAPRRVSKARVPPARRQ